MGNIQFDQISNNELIDSYINFELYGSKENQEFTSYSELLVAELSKRGIEIVNRTTPNPISKFHNFDIFYNPDIINNVNEKQVNVKRSEYPVEEQNLIKYSVSGQSMVNYGVFDGDLVLISKFDSSITDFQEICQIINNKLLVVNLNGKDFIKVAEKAENCFILKSFNPKYYNFKVLPTTNFSIQGIVQSLIRQF